MFNAQVLLYAHEVIHLIGAADGGLPAMRLRVTIGDHANVQLGFEQSVADWRVSARLVAQDTAGIAL